MPLEISRNMTAIEDLINCGQKKENQEEIYIVSIIFIVFHLQNVLLRILSKHNRRLLLFRFLDTSAKVHFCGGMTSRMDRY